MIDLKNLVFYIPESDSLGIVDRIIHGESYFPEVQPDNTIITEHKLPTPPEIQDGQTVILFVNLENGTFYYETYGEPIPDATEEIRLSVEALQRAFDDLILGGGF